MAKEIFRSGFLSLIGASNAGKSTLINALVQNKISIVSHKPQTTRNRIMGVVDRESFQAVIVDTPGFQKRGSKGLIDNVLKNSLREGVSDVDLRVLVIDSLRIKKEKSHIDEVINYINKGIKKPIDIICANKIDLLKKDEILPLIEEIHNKKFLYNKKRSLEIIPISSKKKINLENLLEVIKSKLKKGPRYFPEGTISSQEEKFLISELIREKVFNRLHKEIPYSVAVKVEKMEEEENFLKIGALILVERESQKPIVIGKSAETIKSIGIKARKDLEKALGVKVFLDLRVKVQKSWTKTKAGLLKAGYKI